jgi:hypothetical protein
MPQVRVEIARQLREAVRSARHDASLPRIELHETDPRNDNKMPLSNVEALQRMRRSVFCMAPTGDGDGFTSRFYYSIATGCIPVRVDTYYPDRSFGRVAWPFKKTIQWHRAVVLLPPHRLHRDGIIATIANISAARITEMQQYINNVVRPAILFDYRGTAPDAFSAFLTELLHLARKKLVQLDKHKQRAIAT